MYDPTKKKDSFRWHKQKSQLSAQSPQEDVIKTGRGIVTTTTDNNDPGDTYDETIEMPSNIELGRKATKPLFRTRTGKPGKKAGSSSALLVTVKEETMTQDRST
jgi:hypothetical protein